MKEYKIEISALDYARMSQLPYGECNAEVSRMCPNWIHQGNGYYGSKLAIRDGKYFAIASIGDTCD